MFATIPKSFTKDLNIVLPKLPQVEVTKVVKDVLVLMRLYSEPELTSSYSNLSLLLFAAGWAELKLGMKRSRPERKSTVYVQTALKKRKRVSPWRKQEPVQAPTRWKKEVS